LHASKLATKKNKTKSETNWIKDYLIHHLRLDFETDEALEIGSERDVSDQDLDSDVFQSRAIQDSSRPVALRLNELVIRPVKL